MLYDYKTPPCDNMGVENKNTTWHIDYLVITVWSDRESLINDFDDLFYGTFSAMSDQGHGGRFYKDTYTSDLGIMLRTNPVNSEEKRSTLEIPGRACQALGYERLANFVHYLHGAYDRVAYNRIDIAFDHCPFTVEQVYESIIDEDLRSYFKRNTLRYFENKFEKRENGDTGTSGITTGGRSSTRYMRIYNKHGYTRLEIEFKAEKAEQVAIDLLFEGNKNSALKLAMGHVRDYVDFFSEWWQEFINEFERNYAKLPTKIKELCTSQIRRWFESQIAGAFYVLSMVEGAEYFDDLFTLGKVKVLHGKRARYRNFVAAHGKSNFCTDVR